MLEHSNVFRTELIKNVEMNYLTFLPEDYDDNTTFPMLMFLHGIGERGTDLEKVKVNGVSEILAQPNFPFVLICPQCPIGSSWSNEADSLNSLIDEVLKAYNIDENRMYLTGLSMGGFGTWDFALKYPNRFAALAPVCGGTMMLEDIHHVKDVPIWAFHGEKDRRIPIDGARRLVRALEAIGGRIKFTTYPNVGHNAWTSTYQNSELYKWFLSYRKDEMI